MPCDNTLLACLNAEINATSTFIDLLEQEAELLADSVALDTLPALTQVKQRSADHLSALAQSRAQHLDTTQGVLCYQRTEALASEDDALWYAWQTLLDLLDQAQGLSRRNGALIDVHLRHTQQSLHALRAATGAGELYAVNGRACTLTLNCSGLISVDSSLGTFSRSL